MVEESNRDKRYEVNGVAEIDWLVSHKVGKDEIEQLLTNCDYLNQLSKRISKHRVLRFKDKHLYDAYKNLIIGDDEWTYSACYFFLENFIFLEQLLRVMQIKLTLKELSRICRAEKTVDIRTEGM